MVLYKILITLILLSTIVCNSENILDNQKSISLIGNSNYTNGTYKINFGIAKGGQSLSYNFFSINKLVSHNLVVSSLISKFDIHRTDIFIQNSMLFKALNNSMSLQMIANHLFLKSRVDKWNIFGANYYFFLKKSIFSLGILCSNKDGNNRAISNSLSIEHKINSKLSINYSFLNSKDVKSNLINLSINI